MADPPTSWPRAVLGIACLAAVVTVAVVVAQSDGHSTPPPADDPLATDAAMRELAARVDRLEHELAVLRMPTHVETPPEPLRGDDAWLDVPTTGAGARTLAGLEARLRQLEGFENARQRALAEAAAERARQEQRRREHELALRDLAHAIILDPQHSDAEKAEVWRDLRDFEGEAWTDAIVLEMTQIGATSEDARAREVVWIGAESRHRHELLVDPLIRALATDVEADVREEAADALSLYLDVPGVRAALQRASRSDASGEVREEALASLLGVD